MKQIYRCAVFVLEKDIESNMGNIFLRAISKEQAAEHAAGAYQEILISNGYGKMNVHIDVTLSSQSEVDEYNKSMNAGHKTQSVLN